MKDRCAKLLAILAAATLFMPAAGPPHARAVTITETRVTSDPGKQILPDVYGDTIVWMDLRHGDYYEIYAYDVRSGTERRVSYSDSAKAYPQIYGNIIIWLDSRDGPYLNYMSIYMYDLSTGIEARVPSEPGQKLYPRIHGDTIVWMDYRDDNWDVYYYRIGEESETRVTDSPDEEMYPDIYGGTIAWLGEERRGEEWVFSINAYSVETGETRRLSEGSWVVPPRVYGERVVWGEDRDLDGVREIYAYDLSAGVEAVVATFRVGSVAVPYLDVYGDAVVYTELKESSFDDLDVMMCSLSSGERVPVADAYHLQIHPAIHGDLVVWTDGRNIAGDENYDIYMARLGWGVDPSGAAEQARLIQEMVAGLPTASFDGPNDRVRENRRNALLNMLEAVVDDLMAASESGDPSTQRAAIQSALDQLASLLAKTDGCHERGAPDARGSGYTPDWIITCEGQALLDPAIRALMAELESMLAQIP